MEAQKHRFGPGETITAVIRKFNREDLQKEQMRVLMAEFNSLNGRVVPRVGETFKIPVHDFEKEPRSIPDNVIELRKAAKALEKTSDIDIEEKHEMLSRQKRREAARLKKKGIELPKELLEVEINPEEESKPKELELPEQQLLFREPVDEKPEPVEDVKAETPQPKPKKKKKAKTIAPKSEPVVVKKKVEKRKIEGLGVARKTRNRR